MTQLTNRQQKIINFIGSKDHVQNQDIVDFFPDFRTSQKHPQNPENIVCLSHGHFDLGCLTCKIVSCSSEDVKTRAVP